jgi:hypothetical protein
MQKKDWKTDPDIWYIVVTYRARTAAGTLAYVIDTGILTKSQLKIYGMQKKNQFKNKNNLL